LSGGCSFIGFDFRIFSDKICLILFSWGVNFEFLRGLHRVEILLGNSEMANNNEKRRKKDSARLVWDTKL